MAATDNVVAKTIYLPDELVVELDAEARAAGRTGISAHIRFLLSERSEIKRERESAAPEGKPDGRRVRAWLERLLG